MGQPGMPGSQFPGEDALLRRIKDLEREVQQFAAANVLATAGIGAVTGGVMVKGFMEYTREDGTRGVRVDPVTGAFTVYEASGVDAVARFGELIETAPGEYGVEVDVDGTWVRLGAQAVTWDLVSGKPADFGPFVLSNVPSATTATSATTAGAANHAAQADGSEYGWTNNVAGTSFFAAWIGNDGGFHFGRNVSSIKYKVNVTDSALDPAAVLNLRPVRYDRKPTYRFPTDADGNRLIGPEQEFKGAKNEFGLIAEEVADHVPEIVTTYDGEIDGVRYDLLGVALLPVVQQQAKDIAAMKQAIRDLGGSIT